VEVVGLAFLKISRVFMALVACTLPYLWELNLGLRKESPSPACGMIYS
jgi:hypothetical protein